MVKYKFLYTAMEFNIGRTLLEDNMIILTMNLNYALSPSIPISRSIFFITQIWAGSVICFD